MKALLFPAPATAAAWPCASRAGGLVTVCTAHGVWERSAPAMSTSGFMSGAWTGGDGGLPGGGYV